MIISAEELKFLSSIRSILMIRAKLPSDFEHVGPENSEEEDQFYKYRVELADIFKNTLDIPGAKEAVLDELFSYFSTLNTHSQVEDIELPLFLIYHFAEKVQDIGALLKTQNKYTDLIGMIVKFPIPQHRIVIKMYLENIVRYSAYFDGAKFDEFQYALEHFLVNLRNPDKDVKKHVVYMLYRLAIKNPSLLISNAQCNKVDDLSQANPILHVETILKSISEAISSEFLEADSVNHLYKTIGMIIGFRKIDPQVQIQLFNRLCDMIISRASKESIIAFIEVLSGFTSKVHNEMVPKLKQTAEIVLSYVLQSEKSNDTITSTCLLLQKLIDTLEIESGIYIKTGLEHLIESVNMDTLESFFSVISNFCHKINTGYEVFIPLELLRKLVIQIISNIPMPTETISDLAQQAISVRRSLVKILIVLLAKLPQFFDFPEILNLINYIGAMSCNFIESSTPKIALSLLNKFLETITMNAPNHEVSKHIVVTAFEISIEILTRKKVNTITPDISQTTSELVNIHKSLYALFVKHGQEDQLSLNFQKFIAQDNLRDYIMWLEYMTKCDQKTSQTLFVKLKSVLISYIEANKVAR